MNLMLAFYDGHSEVSEDTTMSRKQGLTVEVDDLEGSYWARRVPSPVVLQPVPAQFDRMTTRSDDPVSKSTIKF